MVRPLKGPRVKAPRKFVSNKSVTPLVYYGGKSRDNKWIISKFPPHEVFVDVFGGGASVVLGKLPSATDVYNDIGNVSNFFYVLRTLGSELYEALYLTPWSREEFEVCWRTWRDISNMYLDQYKDWSKDAKNKEASFTMYFRENADDWELVEWARCWYSTIMQSFTHEEMATSWKTTKTMDLANVFVNKVEELPEFTDRFRRIIIENQDFMAILRKYDSKDTLFYLDPPYSDGTRSSHGNYVNELPVARHQEMLLYLTTKLQGQAVVSNYSDPLYERMLSERNGWLRHRIEHKGMIVNSTGSSGIRQEVLWVKEHARGLWSDETFTSFESSSDVPGIQGEDEGLSVQDSTAI